ncbi:porin [Paraburkholderia strydomiana]|uniref:porin n=1 Tax=Paraburkholderia strydomiana TaxID=1245417 RepID=UPI002854B65B|nr:porin [Paraburkholderia strydomiana]MDR7008885.1 putative porin [Paraburkholderia strydomiana]
MNKCVTIATTAVSLASGIVCAQSSVTLYGVVDNGVTYQNSGTTLGSTTGGHSAVKMSTGVWLGSRFGLKGAEDLSGGLKAIFQLEAGVNSNNGTSQFSGGMFTRQSWLGLSDPRYGVLTAGRQYTAYYTLLSPYTPNNWLTGYFGAHPGDIDALDVDYRASNSLVYMSPEFYGFTVGGSYAFGGAPGSINAGSSWSAGARYGHGPYGIAVAFQRVNNSTPGGGVWGAESTLSNGGDQTAVSAINNGYKTAQAQQRVAVTAGYLTSGWDITASYSNVQYIPGIDSTFRNQATFNTAGAVVRWKSPAAPWVFAGGYSYTRATLSNGIDTAAQYHQLTLSQYYYLSKRTGLYAVEAYQRSNGMTLNGAEIIDATASIGNGFNNSPSSSRSQFGAGVGLIHNF